MEPPTGLLAPNCFKWIHCFPSTMQNWILLTMAPSPICLPLNPSPMRPPGFKGHHYNSGSCVPTKMCLMKLVTSALSPTLQKHRDSEEGSQIKRNPSIFAVKQWSFPLGSPCLPRHNSAEECCASHREWAWERRCTLRETSFHWRHSNVQGNVIDMIHI